LAKKEPLTNYNSQLMENANEMRSSTSSQISGRSGLDRPRAELNYTFSNNNFFCSPMENGHEMTPSTSQHSINIPSADSYFGPLNYNSYSLNKSSHMETENDMIPSRTQQRSAPRGRGRPRAEINNATDRKTELEARRVELSAENERLLRIYNKNAEEIEKYRSLIEQKLKMFY
jgi:hypothetical protein